MKIRNIYLPYGFAGKDNFTHQLDSFIQNAQAQGWKFVDYKMCVDGKSTIVIFEVVESERGHGSTHTAEDKAPAVNVLHKTASLRDTEASMPSENLPTDLQEVKDAVIGCKHELIAKTETGYQCFKCGKVISLNSATSAATA